MPAGLDTLRASGLRAYTFLRKVLHQLDKLHKEGVDGPRVFAAARTLKDLERIAVDLALPAFEKELKDWIRSTRDRIDRGQEEYKNFFSAELERLLSEQFSVQVRGAYPLLIASYLRIKIDVEQDSVVICYGADEDPLEKTRANPEKVARKMNSVQRELEGKLLPDDAFLGRFAEAYDRVLKLNHIDPGENAPIMDVLSQFVWSIQSKKFLSDPRRENFRSYSRVNLSYQLHKLVNRRAGHRTMELVTASREETTRKERRLWVPRNEEGDGSYLSAVSFK